MSNSKGPIDMEKKDNLGSNKLPASHLVRLAQHRLCKLSPSDALWQAFVKNQWQSFIGIIVHNYHALVQSC